MKKILLSILFAGVASLANAQKSEVNAAKTQWLVAPITKGKSLAENLKTLNTGLDHTSKAIVDEKSKEMVEAWSYRALFASKIALIDSLNASNSKAKQKIAEEAIEKAKALDTKDDEKANLATASLNIENALRNRAIFAYNKKDYANALAAFNDVTKRTPTDTAMFVNAGVVARELKNYPEVVRNFKKAIDLGYKGSKTLYGEIISASFDQLKDSVGGMALLKEASAKFPDDPYFLGVETNIYLNSGDIVKSQELLAKLIAKNPKNASYQSLMGDTYYKQAIAVQVERSKLDAKKTKEYNALNVKMTKFIDQSIPYYKAALAIDPKNEVALENLKVIYAFKGDKVNSADITKRLNALK